MRRSLLDSLTEEQRAVVETQSTRRSLKNGEPLFFHGDTGDFLAVVLSGRLAAQVTTMSGQTAILRVVSPGDVVGELALLLPGAARNATVVAIEASELRIISGSVFAEARRHHPEIDNVLVEDLAARLHQASNDVVVARYGTVAQRVAGQLLVLDELYRHDWIPLTQDALAALAGGIRQTVNRALRDTAANKLVEVRRGGVRVLDRDGLADLAR